MTDVPSEVERAPFTAEPYMRDHDMLVAAGVVRIIGLGAKDGALEDYGYDSCVKDSGCFCK